MYPSYDLSSHTVIPPGSHLSQLPRPDLPLGIVSNGSAPRVSTLARRIHGWSWQAFPIGMGKGAVHVTLSGLKEHSGPLTNVETVFFFINLALFILNSSTLLLQAILYPRQSRRLINDPVKRLFVPLIFHAHYPFVYMLIATGIYVFQSVFVCFPMLMIWYNKPHDLTTFTPAWAFLIFPMMLVGVIASEVLLVMDLLIPAQLACSQSRLSSLSGEIWFSSSVLVGFLLFGLAVFLFTFSLLPYWYKVHKHLNEILGCWALMFQNVGWISSLRVLGDTLQIPAFFVFAHYHDGHDVCLAWAVLFGLTALAFWKGKIFLAAEEDVLRDKDLVIPMAACGAWTHDAKPCPTALESIDIQGLKVWEVGVVTHADSDFGVSRSRIASGAAAGQTSGVHFHPGSIQTTPDSERLRVFPQ
ncbi:hypothetical protein BJV74DRAFT_925957 [Russula compacta]|nr:hypothetical protein BJV74DRAFT_925957 [Russula compacta]